MKKEESEQWLNDFNPNFLVVGFRPDGIRGIPATYKEFILPVEFPKDVYSIADTLTDFKVFDLQPNSIDKKKWLELKIQFESERTEKEERELLEKLKAKYEPQ